jgi:hypothetical protein
MKAPPFGNDVANAPPGYWSRGTRVFIFAGPASWDWARWWRDDRNVGVVPEARFRYTLCLPPDMTDNAACYRWPVEGRRVLIIDTGAGVEALQPLIAALQRDGCGDGEVFDVHAQWLPEIVEQKLANKQPWRVADFDADVMGRYAARLDQVVEFGLRPGESMLQPTPPFVRTFERRPTRDELVLEHVAWVEQRGDRALAALRQVLPRDFVREVEQGLAQREAAREQALERGRAIALADAYALQDAPSPNRRRAIAEEVSAELRKRSRETFMEPIRQDERAAQLERDAIARHERGAS